MFSTFLELGFDHILDINAYDHILFVMTLCAIYAASQWEKVLILVTAFTIGHSITLALSTLNLVSISPELVEFLIPLTIIITSLYNMYKVKAADGKVIWHYGLASFFGLIHGLGFSNYLKAILGNEDDLVVPLLSFNLGVELGQIIVVVMTIIVSYILVNVFKLPQRYWVWTISVIAILVSLYLIFK